VGRLRHPPGPLRGPEPRGRLDDCQRQGDGQRVRLDRDPFRGGAISGQAPGPRGTRQYFRAAAPADSGETVAARLRAAADDALGRLKACWRPRRMPDSGSRRRIPSDNPTPDSPAAPRHRWRGPGSPCTRSLGGLSHARRARRALPEPAPERWDLTSVRTRRLLAAELRRQLHQELCRGRPPRRRGAGKRRRVADGAGGR
jgi:hypothetical protein